MHKSGRAPWRRRQGGAQPLCHLEFAHCSIRVERVCGSLPLRLTKVGRATRGLETPKVPSPPPGKDHTERSVGEGVARPVHLWGLQSLESSSALVQNIFL